jgi:hypothetical protein
MAACSQHCADYNESSPGTEIVRESCGHMLCRQPGGGGSGSNCAGRVGSMSAGRRELESAHSQLSFCLPPTALSRLASSVSSAGSFVLLIRLRPGIPIGRGTRTEALLYQGDMSASKWY